MVNKEDKNPYLNEDEVLEKGSILNHYESTEKISKNKIIILILSVSLIVLIFFFLISGGKGKEEKNIKKIETTTEVLKVPDVPSEKLEQEIVSDVETEDLSTEPVSIPTVGEVGGFDSSYYSSNSMIMEPEFDSNITNIDEPKKNKSSIGYIRNSGVIREEQSNLSEMEKLKLEEKKLKEEIERSENVSGSSQNTPVNNSGSINKFRLDKKIENNYKYTLHTGKLIPSVLLTELNSDIQGQMIAYVRENVYSNKALIIPQGTKIYGVYDSKVEFAQERLLVIWTRLIFPNGKTLDLEGMAGVDLRGAAGLSDKTNFHTLQLFKGVLLSASFGWITGSLEKENTTNNNGITKASEQVNQFGEKVSEKYLSKNPTIKIRSATKFNIMINKDIQLPPYKM